MPDAAAEPGRAPLPSDEVSGALALIGEMTRSFADSAEIDRTLERALASIVRHVGAEVGSLWLVSEDERELVCHASVGPKSIAGVRLPIGEGIVGRSVRENACQQVLDAQSDPAFSQAVDEQSGFRTRSLLCAPMSFEDRPLGAIEVVNKRSDDGRFGERDSHVLEILAASAALAVANARMAVELAEHERVRRELELAAEIQRTLLPARRPPPFPVFGANVPARTVSGDFFDILPLADGRIAFCLGDVSGKGMNAALLMAKTASLYRCLAKSIESPAELLDALNAEVCETATRGMFVTMVAGLLDSKTGRVRFANAGHVPPVRHSASDGSFLALPPGAPPLGILADSTFAEEEIELAGASLYVFSDGLTEACAGRGEPADSASLEGLLARVGNAPAAERVDLVLSEVRQLDVTDDLTLLLVSGEGLR